MAKKETITVAGTTFSADQVKSVTLEIDEHEVTINESDKKKKKMGFGRDSEKD